MPAKNPGGAMRLSFEKIAGNVPLTTSRGAFFRRESLLVSLAGDDGKISQGECAPWDGFGCETLAQAEKFLIENQAFAGTRRQAIPENLPCLAHAISAAEYFAENPHEYGKPPPPRRACAKLVRRGRESTVEEILAAVARGQAEGFPVFKIKIGLGVPAEELAFCREILARAPRGTKIRFDANGAFPPEILPALRTLSSAPALDFFEQPFPPTADNDVRLFALDAAAQKKFALDESVCDPSAFPPETGVVAVVKPLLAGDFRRLLTWLENPRGARVVISTAFENTAAGRSALFQACARVAPERALPFGLGFGDAANGDSA